MDHMKILLILTKEWFEILKNEVYKYVTLISINVYTAKLDNIVDKYNNTYHRATKIKPLDSKTSTYINLHVKNNDKDPKFKVGDHIRASQNENIIEKSSTPSCW